MEHVSIELDIKPIITIDDFLKQYTDLISPDFQDILQLNFSLNRDRNFRKISPVLKLAEPKDAKEIAELFKIVYNGTYPYKRLENVREIQKMIKDPNYEWIIFKLNHNEIIGCYGAIFNFKEKKGFFQGLVIKKKYQKIIDSLKALIGSLIYFWKKYKNKILVWSCEIRTNNSTSQYMGSICGLKPIAFLPNKDIFFNRIESNFLIITYDDKVLKIYRKREEPRIIRQILNCYAYSNKRYHLGIPIIENPIITFNPININLIKSKIKKGKKKDHFGNETITFSINGSNSYFKFSYNPFIQSVENIKYKIVELEELYIFIEELKDYIQKYDIRYAECFVSSYNPKHQKIFHDAGFKPRGYVPCWKFNKKYNFYEDSIVFNYYKGTFDNKIMLIPETKELLQILNFFEEKLIIEPLDVLHF